MPNLDFFGLLLVALNFALYAAGFGVAHLVMGFVCLILSLL